jgi:hypothetical protein
MYSGEMEYDLRTDPPEKIAHAIVIGNIQRFDGNAPDIFQVRGFSVPVIEDHHARALPKQLSHQLVANES